MVATSFLRPSPLRTMTGQNTVLREEAFVVSTLAFVLFIQWYVSAAVAKPPRCLLHVV